MVAAMPHLSPILGLALVAACAATTVAAADLASHRAAYRLTLEVARSASDVQGAEGAMLYEAVDQCDAWTVRQRFSLTVTARSGATYAMGSDYVTWEAKDGSRLRFRLRQTTDGAVTQSIAGEARRTPGAAGSIRYTEPAEDEVPLPAAALFPMAHTARVLDAAAAGQRVFAAPVFDGTVTEGAQDTNAAITARLDPGAANGTRWAPLAALASFRMRIAFFETGSSTGQPDYEVAMRYWTNGVGDELSMDFGDFTVAGAMSELEMLPDQCN
jgi:opacity protein-like surface antigen